MFTEIVDKQPKGKTIPEDGFITLQLEAQKTLYNIQWIRTGKAKQTEHTYHTNICKSTRNW